MRFKVIFAVSILLLITSKLAGADTLPFDEIKWKTVNKVDSCAIQSDFDELGYQFSFIQAAGNEGMELILSGWKIDAISEKQNMIFYAESPSWGSEQNTRQVIAQVTNYRNGDVFKGKEVKAMLEVLKSGHWLNIEADMYSLTVPNTGIFDVVKPFNVCLATLPKTTYEDAYNTKIYFQLNQKRLTESNKKVIADLASLIRKDSSIKKVMVDGYTDNIGSSVTNLSVSKTRAKSIAYQLTVDGVPAELINVTGQGERFPMASNKTAAGRDQNRRVEIRLIR